MLAETHNPQDTRVPLDRWRLQQQGHTDSEISVIHEYLAIRAEHRNRVERARKSAEQLRMLQDFITTVLEFVRRPIQKDGLDQMADTKSDRHDRAATLREQAVALGASERQVERYLSNVSLQTLIEAESDEYRQVGSQIGSQQRQYNSLQSRLVSERVIQQEVAKLCRNLFSESESDSDQHYQTPNSALQQLFDSERKIGTPAESKPVSMFELFSNNIETVPAMLAHINEHAAESLLAQPDIATYDGYRWVRRVSSAVANEGLRVFPTPTTEEVKEHISLAMTKRNGIFKYILFGDAGAGKTTLGKIVDADRGKDTVVINFHHFLSFEELIGQMAISLDIVGDSSIDKFQKAADRFSASNSNEETFWHDMERVHNSLSAEKKQQYPTVELLVAQYGVAGSLDAEQELTKDRSQLRLEFLNRLQTLRDQALLGLKPEESLAGKWVEGAVVQAIRAGNIVCFDEIDKAGPTAVEGLLSFWGLKPGERWKYQGQEITIPADWYCWGTSNSRAIGSLSGSEDMNRFLADRCEQIPVPVQPVKDSLMIAAVHLSDDKGTLLVSERDQQYLIAAFSHLIPRLQVANLAMPITNRVVETICSRLVQRDVASGLYRRVRGSDGLPRSVSESLRLSLLEMKQLSMSRDDKRVIQEIFAELSQLLGEGRVSSILDDFEVPDLYDSAPRYVQRYGDTNQKSLAELKRRVSIIESVWNQPLFVAIGALQSATHSGLPRRPRSVPATLFDPQLLAAVSRVSEVPSLHLRKLGGMNGEMVRVTDGQVFVRALDRGNAVAEIPIGSCQAGPNPEILADQTLETIAVVGDGSATIFKAGKEVLTLNTDGLHPLLLDPQGRYILFDGQNGLEIQEFTQAEGDSDTTSILVAEGQAVVRSPMQTGSRAAHTPTFQLNADVVLSIEQTQGITGADALIDVSPDGNLLLIRTNSGQLALIDMIQFRTGNKLITPVGTRRWNSARFVGNSMLVGIGSADQVLSDPADNPLVIVS